MRLKKHILMHLQILLQIMDEGTVQGNNGKAANCKNIVLILTTNLGADQLDKNVMGSNAQKQRIMMTKK